jgi:hypothetical protein
MNPDLTAPRTTEQRIQDACLLYHGWTRDVAPKGAIHKQRHCKFCKGYARGLDALTAREGALVETLALEHLAYCEETGQMSHADDVKNRRWRDYCATCALLDGQPPDLSGQAPAQDEVALQEMAADVRSLSRSLGRKIEEAVERDEELARLREPS